MTLYVYSLFLNVSRKLKIWKLSRLKPVANISLYLDYDASPNIGVTLTNLQTNITNILCWRISGLQLYHSFGIYKLFKQILLIFTFIVDPQRVFLIKILMEYASLIITWFYEHKTNKPKDILLILHSISMKMCIESLIWPPALHLKS